MRLIGIAVVLTFSLLAAPVTGESQQASKVYRVGFLHWGSLTSDQQIQIQAFEQELRQRGWVTGENLVITYRYAEGQYDRLPALAGELARLEPHVIVALPTVATRAAKDVTSTIPIVMMNVSDPIGERLISSLARPGANVTGLTMIPTFEIYAKQLQLLKEAVPRAQRIALLWNPANRAAAPIVRTVEDAARALGVELRVTGARAPEEFEPAFRAMTQARVDALFVVPDRVFSTHKARLFDLSRRHAAETQQAGKVYRIGFLGPSSASTHANRVEALRAGLRELGYVEGKNILIEYRWAEGKYDRLPGLAAELVHLKVDVLVTFGTPGTLAAKQTTTTIPIVMAGSGDAVATGLVSSLARPGSNITGSTLFIPELMAKRLELLKEAIPRTGRVAVLVNPDNSANMPVLKAMEATARSLKVELQKFEARGPNEFESAFSAMAKSGVGAAVVNDDALFNANARAIADLAAKKRLPLAGTGEIAEAGGSIGYGVSFPDEFRRAAVYVDKILKGAKPADLPVEQPTKFELVINLKTAKALGLTIPQTLLQRADQVIQ